MNRTVSAVSGRLSLRRPQVDSLTALSRAVELAPAMLDHERDLAAVLAALRAEFPTLEDFEREFPSLCFALATGVGKTRLMGAFVSYLHLAHGINNFFVLAPNLTIYNKLIADFTPNTPKYVFKGIAEFAQQVPEIITGDNYEERGHTVDALSQVTINIFNISKINSEVRGGKEPRIKRMREVLGDSYFEYLARLPDLVLLMDESHRYRASAGVRAINELKPLFGLELTATPYVEASGGKRQFFRNVVVDYPLARAMEDGFVKEPAVVTQRNFDAKSHKPEELEKIKLEDGVRLHEITKVELLTYAHENDAKIVKPFMLVIARDTTHAAQLLELLESDQFYGGRYKGKVIQVDSSRTGAEEDAMIERLLAVESVDEPTEIVIHVNMLKEGWDVTNLYTIVPLRAANSRVLIEQSIGRGLRLPYGKRTGVAEVDRLNIVAHDKFQEIIDEANKGDSPIRLKQVILEAPGVEGAKTSIQINSGAMVALGLDSGATMPTVKDAAATAVPLFKTENDRQAARVVEQVVRDLSARPSVAPTSATLMDPQLQASILAEVQKRLVQEGKAAQDWLFAAQGLDLPAIVATTITTLVQGMIDIPRITVVPSGDVTMGFHPFKLDLSQLRLQPSSREIVGQNLRNNEQFTYAAQLGMEEKRPEDYIVFSLIDYDDIDYDTNAGLLYDLAGQMVAHLRSYLPEADVLQVLNADRNLIARQIHTQMMAHFWEKATSYDAQVSHGFMALRPLSYSVSAEDPPRNIRETVVDKSRIKQMLFGGFTRCLYPQQRFDSDTERRFAVILERDALRWFKPAKGQFGIYYKLGAEHPEYIPDFVAESDKVIYMVETKRADEVASAEVEAKANAARTWCRHASEYSVKHGGKPWKYVLIPHDEIQESRTLSYFERFGGI